VTALSRAEHQLILDHLGLVKSVAARRCPPKEDPQLYEDLVAIGNLRLVELARDYDSTRNSSFGCYARQYLDWAMLKALRERARDQYVPLDTVTRGNSGDQNSEIGVADPNAPNPEALNIAAEKAKQSQAICRVGLLGLSKRDRQIVTRHFGRGEKKAEIARDYDLHRSRIQQICDRVEPSLHEHLAAAAVAPKAKRPPRRTATQIRAGS